VSKKFLTDAIVRSTAMPAVAANRLAADIIDAIKGEIIGTGRFTLPDFGAFVVRETPKRSALTPRTGETGRCRPARPSGSRPAPRSRKRRSPAPRKGSGRPPRADPRIPSSWPAPGWVPRASAVEGIVKLAGFGARSITRQHCAGVHAAIWAQVSCRHTRKASARARRY
jgi:DNA-binding protein HU-beta